MVEMVYWNILQVLLRKDKKTDINTNHKRTERKERYGSCQRFSLSLLDRP